MEQEQIYSAEVPQQQPVEEVTTRRVLCAGFWIRFVANFLDGLVLVIPNIMVGFFIQFTTIGIVQIILTSLSGLLVSWVYFVAMTHTYQMTLGKKALGLMVISSTSENVTLKQILLRETIGKLASLFTLFIGFIMAGFTEKKQALHDKIADTLVIYKDPNKKRTVWVWVAIIGVLFVFFFAIIGIFSSIVLVSLNNAKDRASDASLKDLVGLIIPDALLYKDEKGTYSGYKISENFKVTKCGEGPILNIAPNGENMAVFVKSCSDEKKYFCGDISGTKKEVDDFYAKGNATSCNPLNVSEQTLQNEQTLLEKDSAETLSQNIFKDDSSKYEIIYPKNWTQKRELIEDLGVVTTSFFSKEADLFSPIVAIQSVEGQELITSEILNTFIKFLQSGLGAEDKNKKIYDEKDFVYTYTDGEKSIGKAFKVEYLDKGVNMKQWTIIIPNGKRIELFSYSANSNQYDVEYSNALLMLDSWKLFK
ncbi:MAG: RDD family protein [Candidatus Moraniibacteriota bacterium]|nr:MAG: RDD family protein [Candidatus Moranbacteria bacterium]